MGLQDNNPTQTKDAPEDTISPSPIQQSMLLPPTILQPSAPHAMPGPSRLQITHSEGKARQNKKP